MKASFVDIEWPNSLYSKVRLGSEWLEAAEEAGITIPTGCLGGSCGACEIEVNGEVVRACVSKVKSNGDKKIKVKFFSDPYW